MTSLVDTTLLYGTPACRKWRDEIFTRHWRIQNELATGFLRHDQPNKIDANRAGNTWLRMADKRLRFGEQPFTAVMDDDEIRDLAKTKAQDLDRRYQMLCRRQSFESTVTILKAQIERNGVAWPAKINASDTPDKIREKHAGAIARVRDPQWWRRALRQALGQQVESVLRDSGSVCKRRAPYLSDFSFKRWQTTQRRNRGTLENLIACSDLGDELPLLDCIEASVANPINRRNELMVRMRGWETIADALQLQGALLTLTAPSQYHAFHFNGSINEKFNHSTPIEAQQYLNGVWSRIRAEWQRNGIKTIGFRICEPHHDGTPHFHFLLFFAPSQWPTAWETFRKHALAVDGDEPGAQEHRCDYQLIDKAKGSATGYVAKYVTKNIDGYGFEDGELDQESDAPGHEGAARARAWASLWGIRQFQQIGAISVTVYRELRRLTQALGEPDAEQVEVARAAADRGDWAAFVDAMGGAFVRRNEQLLRPLKELADKPGRYGDEIRRILGVVLRSATKVLPAPILTRTKTWSIVPRWALENLRDRGLP